MQGIYRQTITWIAHTCRHADASVFLGLAPGLDELALHRALGPSLFASYPGRQLPITAYGASTGPANEVPLRLFSLRDASLCEIEEHDGKSGMPGFKRVKLVFHLNVAKPQGETQMRSAATEVVSSVMPPPIIAYLLTIGMTATQEPHFFNGVVSEFLDHSWSSLPKLLREVGCEDPTAIS